MKNLVVPGYEVWGHLGEGGMSEVWLAKHVALAAPVVVKTLRRELRATTPDAADRILSEARLMARVSSPRIVRALDAGHVIDEGQPTPYLVQEYVDGLDFAELDRRRRVALGVGLPLWTVCRVMCEVCMGLRAAHQAGVIHRDLKPSNVFGDPEIGIRLGDFGIAVARSDTSVPEGAVGAGTPAFMAPEQLRRGEIGRFTDVWGAGATACDLRYGRGPFANVEELLDPDTPPRLPQPASPAEAYFQDVIRRMVAKDLAVRPRDILAPLAHFTMLSNAIEPPPPVATRTLAHELGVGRVQLRFVVGDIADASVAAIVSSANFKMRMELGVAGALKARGGAEIEEEAMRNGEQALGSCVRTGAGALEARHVFHAVSAWSEVSCVGRAFARALLLADEQGCATLAAPALGTGVGRVSIEMCASAMMNTLRRHVMLGGTRLRELTIWLDSEAKRAVYQDVAEEVLGIYHRHTGPADIGLTDDSAARGDAATCVDPDSH
ncbi:MAG: serine/threonine-protein kinase [Labilithrix sp.]|nr:serine/threonine-protein kinase [Labilithrix sp.]MCW5813078.1 serine/threonine-protein kinase [Labilithrix sp.]